MTDMSIGRFREDLRESFEAFIANQGSRFPSNERLAIDLHCHDRNSDVSEETLGRLLRVPESWVPTQQVLVALQRARVDVVTMTNHNNARSCWDLLHQGHDVLAGAEYDCTLPEFEEGLHVLAYGFTPEQETRLGKLRKNLYRFLEYARERNIVTILAHPFHIGSKRRQPPLEILDRLAVLFDAFEVLNGQRDTWLGLLVAAWIETLTPERIDELGRKTGLCPGDWSPSPYRKRMTGGSDCHMGVFAGLTGTWVHVPGLSERRKTVKLSELVLEALRGGDTAPYGKYVGEERLAASFLDYFCQAAMSMRDPGLLRLMLHQGSSAEKLLAFAITNLLGEVRRHRYTMRFLETAHQSLHGKRPSMVMRQTTFKTFRPLVRQLDEVARNRRESPESFEASMERLVPDLFSSLHRVVVERVSRNLKTDPRSNDDSPADAFRAVRRLELPANVRTLLGDDAGANPGQDMTSVNLSKWANDLSFPLLASLLLGGAAFASSRVMFECRPFLDRVSRSIGRFEHPKRLLWLTDSLFDYNGIARTLSLVLDEVCRRSLPVDMAVCDAKVDPSDHLLVFRPEAEFAPSFYRDQKLRIPNLLEVQKAFVEGGYDRIVCSTEFPMGLVALYLKQAYSVPAYFFIQTDWVEFARRTLRFEQTDLDRLRRMLRAFYGAFDGLFVLNDDQRNWLAGESMRIPAEKIHRTAHWVDPVFQPKPSLRRNVFPAEVKDAPIVLYAGRLSDEKGVMELPSVIQQIRTAVPDAQLVVAGDGHAKARLKRRIRDAVFLGWRSAEELASIFASSDVLLLPSRFDTFGNVVLEALSCGLPVVSYRAQGPKDILRDGVCGFLVDDPEAMSAAAIRILTDRKLRIDMKIAALRRGMDYRPDRILMDFFRDIDLPFESVASERPIDAPRHRAAS